jgi:zinc transporter ZupT
MDRLRTPTEFGFTSAPYVPPERRRPTWKTLVFGALLSVIPVVGAGIGAVYIDRRRIPSTYEFGAALKTALIQLLAIALLVLICWIVFGLILGFGLELDPRLTRR